MSCLLDLPIAAAVVASEAPPTSALSNPQPPPRIQWLDMQAPLPPRVPMPSAAALPKPPKASKATKAKAKGSMQDKASAAGGESALAAAAAAHVAMAASATPAEFSSVGVGGLRAAAAELEDETRGEARSKRRPWSPEEDVMLKQLVDTHGVKSWAIIATHLEQRNGKQCRERWRHHLRPGLTKGEWSTEEELEIWSRVVQYGTKWALLAEEYMPGRTENDIKNRWNSIVRRPVAPCGRTWEPEENELRANYLGLTLEGLEGVNGWKRPRPAPDSPRGAAAATEGRASRTSGGGGAARDEAGRAALSELNNIAPDGGARSKRSKGGGGTAPGAHVAAEAPPLVLRIKLSGSPPIVTQWSPNPSPQPPSPTSPESLPSVDRAAEIAALAGFAVPISGAAAVPDGLARPVARAPEPAPAGGGAAPLHGGLLPPRGNDGFMHLLAAARLQ